MSSYQHDYAAFGLHVLSADWMVAEMRRRAEAGVEFAKDIAPVDETGPHPGRYRDSLHAESAIREASGPYKSRAVGRVVSDAPESFIVEFGTEYQQAQRVLGRALDVMGS